MQGRGGPMGPNCTPAPLQILEQCGQRGLTTRVSARARSPQDKLANCAADCADEYRQQVPKLQKDIIERLKTIA